MPVRMHASTTRLCGLLVGLVVAASGCSLHGLAFRKDDRLTIDNLPDRSTIDIPYQLDFSFDGTLAPADAATDTGEAAAFGVLVDWTPPPPGKSLQSLLDDDMVCQGPTGCPEGYLERNRIYTTTDTSILLDNVPVGADDDRRGFHEVTIILVDAQGRRVGETSAWSRFRTPEPAR